MLPSARSPWWALVFVILALALAAALLGLGTMRSGAPPIETLGSVAAVTAGMSAVLSLLGFLGARATFIGAVLGLLVGLVHMLRVYTTSTDGMADLGALLMFLMLGGLGLVIGAVLDGVRAARSRR